MRSIFARSVAIDVSRDCGFEARDLGLSLAIVQKRLGQFAEKAYQFNGGRVGGSKGGRPAAAGKLHSEDGNTGRGQLMKRYGGVAYRNLALRKCSLGVSNWQFLAEPLLQKYRGLEDSQLPQSYNSAGFALANREASTPA